MIIRNVNQDHVAVVHLENCKIIEGYGKIIHEINVTKISQTVQDVKTKILLRQDDDEITTTLRQKILEIETNLQQIQPSRRRTKR